MATSLEDVKRQRAALFDTLLGQRKKVDEVKKRGEDLFLAEVRCSKEAMASIDALYDEEKAAYDSAIEKLDAKFGRFRSAREKFLDKLNLDKESQQRALEEVRHTLKTVTGMPRVSPEEKQKLQHAVEEMDVGNANLTIMFDGLVGKIGSVDVGITADNTYERFSLTAANANAARIQFEYIDDTGVDAFEPEGFNLIA